MFKLAIENTDALRPASEVMDIQRLGVMRSTSLSFLRILIRKMMREAWEIEQTTFDINDEGYGEALYSITTPQGTYTFVALSREISEETRSDRVISERWDVTFALCDGAISDKKLKRMKQELPKQEVGRGDVTDLVWSRANKSQRVFSHVVEALSQGKQPDAEMIYDIGYLFRTTAVYGNGKFGIAPYEHMKDNHTFSGAYQSQMFAVYMLRHFSFDLVEHIARKNNPKAATLKPELKKLLGTGNATGLGMVPYLISHPKLLHQWMWIREVALARAKKMKPTADDCQRFIAKLQQIRTFFEDAPIPDMEVFRNPRDLAKEVGEISKLVEGVCNTIERSNSEVGGLWLEFADKVQANFTMEAQELINSELIDLYPEVIVDLEHQTNADDGLHLIPEMSIGSLREIIKKQYQWAFQYDFTKRESRHYFWYRSAEKEEPRIGERGIDPGDELYMPMNIAEQVQQLATEIEVCDNDLKVAAFLLKKPELRGIVRRIQSLDGLEYGEIQANLTGKDLLPVYLLRCKLAILGAERYDPKSNRWVRITLFQGAPLVEEIGTTSFEDDWFYPLIAKAEEIK
ncbi:hypothetical protein CSV80_05375 [Sporosarcina sp. P12(2017)]|uniref:hypothetical protein n=1 Tax=unclassified Sporosarcina TaxID=2647733 RepID=UPI000C167917|nr:MULTISPECIES: hypothetical protein [unclassified Sporosarcina]PIC58381.1 hypothetical protein CSV81_04355 [Sporosarcina sp. P10]PIC61454.1 hypothetical protein CSV80_05375 [Sporosarcina sp. P12(2017)]